MRPLRLAQKLHKWMALIVGLQLLIWSISGFYMVVVDLDIIHGDHLVTSPAELDKQTLAEAPAILNRALSAHPNASRLEIRHRGSMPVVEVSDESGTFLIDALTGDRLLPPDSSAITALAQSYYAGSGEPSETQLIRSDPPGEIGSRPLPVWRVDFDDAWQTSLYLSPTSGELVTRRHVLWRVFDFLWMLHIMDYESRENVNNLLLRIASLLAMTLVVTGLWYLYLRLRLSGRRSRTA